MSNVPAQLIKKTEQVPLFTLSKYAYDCIAGIGLTDVERVEPNETTDQAQGTDDPEKTDE